MAAPLGSLVSYITAGPVTPRPSILISELIARASGSWRTNAAAPFRPYSSPSLNSRVTERRGGAALRIERSEEHTSELQSRFDLVCRLLLEKKKYSNSCPI